MLIIFALKEINHIVVFLTTRLTAAVLCGWYTLTVPVVMFNIMGGEGGGGETISRKDNLSRNYPAQEVKLYRSRLSWRDEIIGGLTIP